MNVIRAPHAGFCHGVRRAVETATKIAAELPAGETLYTDGPLIHNKHEVARLEALHVRQCADPAALEKGSRILVRAHGITPTRRAWLDELGLNVVDATCPNVVVIQKRCAQAAAEGRSVLILGDPDHAEVVGLVGHCAGKAFVVTGPADIDALAEKGALAADSRVALLSQSTQSEALFAECAETVKKHWSDPLIVSTICLATRSRQGELADLAAKCEKIVVVGSAASANTQRLAQLAGALRPVIVIDHPRELNAADFAGVTTVGLAAGASTPDSLIEATEETLRGF